MYTTQLFSDIVFTTREILFYEIQFHEFMCPAYLRLSKGDKKKLVKYRKNDYPFLVNYEACRDCRSYFSSAMFGICIVLIHVCMYVFVSNMMIYNGYCIVSIFIYSMPHCLL